MDFYQTEQQVVLNGHTSCSIPDTSGVPQGSVLLLTMFANDKFADILCNKK